MLMISVSENFLIESDQCNFCNNATDSILPYIWLCPIIKVFWQKVVVLREEALEISIELNKQKYSIQYKY